MTSIKVFVRPLDLGSARPPISIRQPRLVAVPDRSDRADEPTLADRVFQFLDRRSA